jgi:DNA polymerase-3 subunit beta
MKFTIERKTLLQAMTAANSVVERRNTIPILSNVKIEARDGGLRFTATDLDVEIGLTVKAEVASEGTITVPASMLLDIVRKLPDGAQVECETKETRFTVHSGRSRFVLQSLPSEDFSDLAAGEMTSQFVMDVAAFKRLFAKCLFAVSTEDARYYLNGVYLHRVGADLRGVSTDGHRLAMAWTGLPDGASGIPGVIVPRKTCQLIVKHLDAAQGDVRVSVSANKIMLEWAGTRFVSKLIDGTFPDYERVVPRGNNKIATLDVKAAMTAVDRVASVSSEKGRAAKFAVAENAMVISMNSPENGTAEDSVDIAYDGPPLEIGFNSGYVLDLLSNMACDRVRVEFMDAGSPSVVKPEDGDRDCLSVLMPMRVN